MADAAYEAFMATAVQLARTMAGDDAAPLACEFHHRAPADVAIYERGYGCPVQIGRASWRARVGQYVSISGVGVSLKNTQTQSQLTEHTTEYHKNVNTLLVIRFVDTQ